MEEYFSGAKLYGDDFTPQQIAEWYEDEKEGYASLGAADSASYVYQYHAQNRFHAFRHLPHARFHSACGFGSAYGDEFQPIASKVDSLTIVDPSDAFAKQSVHGIPATYVKPAASGVLPLPSNTFGLVTCFDVLHHIPNVSAVIAELARVTAPWGIIILREPIISLGDWRNARPGLTKRERGIPLHLLREAVIRNGLEIEHQSLCSFPVTFRLFNGPRAKSLDGLYNRMFPTLVDAAFCKLFAWNSHYHPRTILQKLCPHTAFLVLKKQPTFTSDSSR